MNEEDEKKKSEEELKEEKERYEAQNQEAYDMDDENELKDRKIREGEGTRDYRERIYPDYKKNRIKNRRQKLPSDADIQTEGNLRGEPTQEEIFNKKTPEEIAEAEKGAKEARRIIEQGKKDRGEDYDPNFAQSIGFEVGANVALDKATGLLLGAPIPGARALYALSNVAGSGIINYLAQRIRGTEFSLGELATASGLSLVPGATQAKTLKGAIGKSTVKGATTGATAVTSESLIDTGEFPDAETVATGALFGGAAGGIFQSVAEKDQIGYAFRALKNRFAGKGGSFTELGTVGAAKRTRSKGFGSLDDIDDLDEFLLSKSNRYDVADESLRKANIDPKSPYYKRLRAAARNVPEYVRRNDDGFLYFDYDLFKDSMRPKQHGRAYIQLFESDLDTVLNPTDFAPDAGRGTKTFREFNIAEFREIFRPAAELLGLTNKKTLGRMDVSNVHHIAALKGTMGIYDGLGFNSPMFKKVNAAMKESIGGTGAERANLIRLVGGTADKGSPHQLAHFFLDEALGVRGENFFTEDVLQKMNLDDGYRLSKARELGRIVADSEKIALQAQDAYKRLADATLATDFKDIQDTLERLVTSKKLGYVKLNNVNYKPIIRETAERGGYNVRQFDELIEDIALIHKAVPTGSPKLIDDLLFSPQLLKSQKSFQKLVTKIEEKFGKQGVTGAEMRRILDAFDVRMQNAGLGQTGLFEDIPDNLIEDVLNNLKTKKQARFTKRNQAKYKKNPNP